MKKRIQRKIDELRQQPEHVRYRTASYITVVSGFILIVLWLAVLLPAQLYLQNRGGNDRDSQSDIFTQFGEQVPSLSPAPQVGGVSDIAPTPSPVFSPSPSPASIPVESVSPAATATPSSSPSSFPSSSPTPSALLPTS